MELRPVDELQPQVESTLEAALTRLNAARRRAYPFHVTISGDCEVTGVVTAAQVMSIDLSPQRQRGGSAPAAVLEKVLSLLDAYID